MSHSKRNTSLAFFTSHERSQLKDRWGSQKARLTRESFLPLASCHLCLQSARDPVACSGGGHVFCRECAVSNLLAQRKEIKRLEREDEKRRAEEADVEREQEDKARDGVVKGFERTMMGLDGEKNTRPMGSGANQDPESEKRGVKRKFEIDEEEMLKNAKNDRAKARKELDEQASKKALPSFWVPSQMPSLKASSSPASTPKLHPVCPASVSEGPTHPLSLKTLITVTFSTSSSTSSSSALTTTKTTSSGTSQTETLICPACKKALVGNSKAMLTSPCGHVICKPCVEKFMTPSRAGTRSEAAQGDPVPAGEEALPLVCYVCETDLMDRTASRNEKTGKKGKEGKERDREKLKHGLIELSTQGTGFAGGGKSMVGKNGVAFQC